MNRKSLLLPVVTAAALLLPIAATAQSFASSNTATPTVTQNQGKKVKTIKITVTNKSTADLDLKAGNDPMTIPAGQSRSLAVPAGTSIVTASESSRGSAGTIVAQITSDMNGSTVELH